MLSPAAIAEELHLLFRDLADHRADIIDSGVPGGMIVILSFNQDDLVIFVKDILVIEKPALGALLRRQLILKTLLLIRIRVLHGEVEHLAAAVVGVDHQALAEIVENMLSLAGNIPLLGQTGFKNLLILESGFPEVIHQPAIGISDFHFR